MSDEYKKLTPFDFIKSINEKHYLMVDETIEKMYVPFIVNRGLSQFIDCVPQTYKMNIFHSLSNRMQYDYLYHSIRKGKRFSKWAKEEKYDHIEAIIEYYQISKEKAIEKLGRMTDDDVKMILKLQNSRGGKL